MLSNVKYDELKDLSKDQILAKMRSGDVDVPAPGPDRDEFLKFTGMGQEERAAFITAKAATPSGTPATEPLLEPAPAAAAVTDPQPPAFPPASPEPVAWDGYGSPDNAMKALRELKTSYEKAQETINKLNAEGGKRGREHKDALENLEKTRRELEEFKKASPQSAAPSSTKKRPVPPDPTNYEEGVVDSKFEEDQKAYYTALDAYESARDAEVEALRKQIETIAPKVDEVHGFVSKNTQAETQTRTDTAWSAMWDKDIPAFQEEFGLKTTVSVKAMSDNWAIVSNPAADAADKDRAKKFLDALPPSDHQAYAKVSKAVNVKYNFASGVPQQNYRTFRGALFENDLLDEYNYSRPVDPSKADRNAAMTNLHRQESESATVLSGAGLGAADPLLSGTKTVDEERQEMRALFNEYKTATIAGQRQADLFEKSEKFKKLNVLCTKFGLKGPGGKNRKST
jgi:myosin heavy subunit